MSDIKPCPFCGSDEIEVNEFDEPSKSGWDSVECKSCCVEGMGWTADDWNERWGEWVSVDDRLPMDSGFVLARSVGGLSIDGKFSTGTIVVYFSKLHSKSDAFQSQHRASSVSVTHWMPLPAPPK